MNAQRIISRGNTLPSALLLRGPPFLFPFQQNPSFLLNHTPKRGKRERERRKETPWLHATWLQRPPASSCPTSPTAPAPPRVLIRSSLPRAVRVSEGSSCAPRKLLLRLRRMLPSRRSPSRPSRHRSVPREEPRSRSSGESHTGTTE